MTAPLREPFFLRGRTSVLQRAVLMSFGMAVLAAVNAWGAILVFLVSGVLILPPPGVWMSDWPFYITGGTAPVLCIFAPLNTWNGRSWTWTLTAAFVVPMAVAQFLWWQSLMKRLHLESLIASHLGYCGFLAGCGLLLLRAGRRYRTAFLLSILCAILPSSGERLMFDGDRMSFQVAGYNLAPFLASYSWLFLLSAAMAIPWGLPFWWPPKCDGPPDCLPASESPSRTQS